MRSSTLVTPTLSVAAAVKVTLPDTVLLGRSYGSQRRRSVRVMFFTVTVNAADVFELPISSSRQP
jgi:hypothetical protein